MKYTGKFVKGERVLVPYVGIDLSHYDCEGIIIKTDVDVKEIDPMLPTKRNGSYKEVVVGKGYRVKLMEVESPGAKPIPHYLVMEEKELKKMNYKRKYKR